uniref:folate gamma-glutamyl hydrolase n=1 Tax=Seriola lalandi dorsalis TaxID=1841481 RepID=A0A3B4W948_SERLL
MYRPAAAVFAALTAWLWCGAAVCAAAGKSQPLNQRPIIGVLAQENLPGDQVAQGSSYIAASYVKYLEGSGARVVPIRINRTEEEYAKIFSSINGLLLPGGDVDLQTSQFSRAAKIFYSLALKANDAGDYFPIWGTCQGFQQLSVLTANKNLLTLTDTKAVALPLKLTTGILSLPVPVLHSFLLSSASTSHQEASLFSAVRHGSVFLQLCLC